MSSKRMEKFQEALRVFREKALHVHALHGPVMGGEFFPGGSGAGVDVWQHLDSFVPVS